MPNYTPNYNLKKPLGTENYNVEDQNGNMDIIDTTLKNHETLITNAETNSKNYTNTEVSKINTQLTESPQTIESTSSIISLPENAKGQINYCVVKGNTDTNYVKSSNMDKDTNLDGIVDDFGFTLGTGITATSSLDSTEKAQKINITASTTINNSSFNQDVPVNAGDTVSVSNQYKVSGNLIFTLQFDFLDSLNNSLAGYNVTNLTSTSFDTAKIENKVAPVGTVKARIQIKVKPVNIGNTGSAWFKNSMLKKTATVGEYISSGTKSTLPVRATSLNTKGNLWNGRYKSNTIISSGQFGANANSRTTERIPCLGLSQIKIIGGNRTNWRFEDINGNYLGTFDGSIATIPQNSAWCYCYYSTDGTHKDITITSDTTATQQIPYNPSQMYTPSDLILRRVGSVYDEFNFVTGEHTKRIAKYTLQASDIIAVNPATNIAYAKTIQLPNYGFKLNQGVDVYGKIRVDDASSAWTADDIGKFAIRGDGALNFPLPAGTTLAQAQSLLTGQELIYQLQNEIKNQYPPQTMQAYKYIIEENIYQDVGYVKSGKVTIASTTPAKRIDNLWKLNKSDGTMIELDVSKVSVASDGLSFTTTDLIETNYCVYDAEYDSSLSASGTKSITINISLADRLVGLEKSTQSTDKKVDMAEYRLEALNIQMDEKQNALGYTPVNKAGDVINGAITFNKTLSANNILLDLQQNYGIYSDNTAGGQGNDTRLWLNAPNNGNVYIGPRGSSDLLNTLFLRTKNLQLFGKIDNADIQLNLARKGLTIYKGSKTTEQSIPAASGGGAVTKITINTAIFNTSEYENKVNGFGGDIANSGYLTVNETGIYLLIGSVSVASGGVIQLGFQHEDSSGALLGQYGWKSENAFSAGATSGNTYAVIKINKLERISLVARAYGSGTVTINPSTFTNTNITVVKLAELGVIG